MSRPCYYNIYPALYDGVDAINNDLNRVAGMEFSGVWINPLFEVSSVPSAASGKVGSPYAPVSFEAEGSFFEDGLSAFEKAAKIREVTDNCRKLGMRCLTDLVLLHVAHDSPLVHNERDRFKDSPVLKDIPDHIDTSKWFVKGTNRLGDDVWDDVVPFNFNDATAAKQINEYYIKPCLDLLIRDWGFDGLRIDSAGMLPQKVYDTVVPYAHALCYQEHKKDLKILAETVGLSPDSYTKLNGKIDLAYGFTHWVLLEGVAERVDPARENIVLHDLELAAKYMSNEIQRGKKIFKLFADNLNNDSGTLAGITGYLKSAVAPVCGFPDNHDTVTISDVCKAARLSKEDTSRANRLVMSVMSFYHDGWFLTSGSEFERKTSTVFTASPKDIDTKKADHSAFVTSVNQTMRQLPDIRSEWKQCVFDPSKPDTIAFILRPGEGFAETPDVIISNVSDKTLKITHDHVADVVRTALERQGQHFDGNLGSYKGHIYLNGNIDPSQIWHLDPIATQAPNANQNEPALSQLAYVA